MIRKKGTMVTARNKKGHEITRNTSFFKPLKYDLDDDYIVENDPIPDEVVAVSGDNAGRRYPLRERRPPTWLRDYESA